MLNIPQDRFLRARDIKTYFSISNTTLHRWLQAGKLPKPDYVNNQMIWKAAAIEEAEASLMAATKSGGITNA